MASISLVFAFLIRICTASRAEVEVEANPMRKVLRLVDTMQEELQREGEVEEDLFDKAMCASDTREQELTVMITDVEQAVDTTSSKLKEVEAEKEQLAQEIGEHQASVASGQRDLAQVTELRKKDTKKLVKEETLDLDGVALLEKAMTGMERELAGRALVEFVTEEGWDELVRIVAVSRLLSDAQRAAVLRFMEATLSQVALMEMTSGDQLHNTAGEAPAADEVMSTFKELRNAMAQDKKNVQSSGQTASQDFGAMKQAKEEEIQADEKALVEKEQRKGGLSETVVNEEHELDDSEDQLANARKELEHLKAERAEKVKDRDMRRKMRAEEVNVLGEVAKILSEDGACDAFKKSTLLQRTRRTYDALLEVKVTHRIAHSSRLLSSSSDTFTGAKHSHNGIRDDVVTLVRGMIHGMVKFLHNADVDDEVKKEFCANETEVNEASKAAKEAESQRLSTEISAMHDDIDTMAAEIKSLEQSIAATERQVSQWTSQRKKEHQEFVDAMSTMSTAVKLIGKATSGLDGFYGGAHGEKQTPSFLASGGTLHQRHRHGSDTPASYAKKDCGKVVQLLSEMKTKLAADMKEAELHEQQEATDFQRDMNDAKASRAEFVKSANQRRSAKAKLDETLVDSEARLESVDQELHNIEMYMIRVHKECDFLLANFQVRHEHRIDQEMGLRSAETIVTHEEPPNQREVESQYDQEMTREDVEANFPDLPANPSSSGTFLQARWTAS